LYSMPLRHVVRHWRHRYFRWEDGSCVSHPRSSQRSWRGILRELRRLARRRRRHRRRRPPWSRHPPRGSCWWMSRAPPRQTRSRYVRASLAPPSCTPGRPPFVALDERKSLPLNSGVSPTSRGDATRARRPSCEWCSAERPVFAEQPGAEPSEDLTAWEESGGLRLQGHKGIHGVLIQIQTPSPARRGPLLHVVAYDRIWQPRSFGCGRGAASLHTAEA